MYTSQTRDISSYRHLFLISLQWMDRHQEHLVPQPADSQSVRPQQLAQQQQQQQFAESQEALPQQLATQQSDQQQFLGVEDLTGKLLSLSVSSPDTQEGSLPTMATPVDLGAMRRALLSDPEFLAELTKARDIQQEEQTDTYLDLPIPIWLPVPQATTERPVTKALENPKWDGSADTFNFWLSKSIRKYNIDAKVGLMGDSQKAWFIICDGLPERKQMMIQTFVNQGGNNQNFYPPDLYRMLKKTFGDDRDMARAQSLLKNLRQQDGHSFAEFFPVFEDLLFKAGGSSWTETAKITWFRGCLSAVLRGYLVPVDLDEANYLNFSQKVKDVAWRMEQTSDWKRLHTTWKRDGSKIGGLPRSYGGINQPDPISNQSFNQNRGIEDSRLQYDTDGDVIMNSVQNRGNLQARGSPRGGHRGRGRGRGDARPNDNPRARFVSQEERNRRRAENRCLRCGVSSHFIKDCPYRPAVPPVSSRQPAEMAHVEPMLEDRKEEDGSEVREAEISDGESLN